VRYPAPKRQSHRAIRIKYHNRHSSPAFSTPSASQTPEGTARRSSDPSKKYPSGDDDNALAMIDDF
jgi:hypothetical protein